MFDSHICSSSLKSTISNSKSSRDKIAISRIPLSSNEKSSFAISYNLVSFSLYFEEFLERRPRLLWKNTKSCTLLGVNLFLFKEYTEIPFTAR